MDEVVGVASALADVRRMRVIVALLQSDMTAQELADIMQLQASAATYQLRLLAQVGLVRMHRSDSDSREAYYECDRAVLNAYCAALATMIRSQGLPRQAAIRVLFVCRANSARSQMAEAFVRELALPHITVQSAGFEVSMIHPLTRAVMAEQGIALAHQQAKTLAAIDEAPDVVISVCDYARRAVAQRWPTATYMHWSIPDPARHGTTQAFRVVRDTIKARVSATFMQESQP